jgi:hypothetical protein
MISSHSINAKKQDVDNFDRLSFSKNENAPVLRLLNRGILALKIGSGGWI